MTVLLDRVQLSLQRKNWADNDEVNDAIARAVLDAALLGDVAFGVIGGAGLMDASVSCVTQRAAQNGIPVRVIPGVGAVCVSTSWKVVRPQM